MPVLRPFRALRYGRDQFDHLDELVSPATQGEPDDRTVVGGVHPLNVRHLVRGDVGPLAEPDEPPFTHAARLLRQWKEDGVLVRDGRPALYIYEQTVDDTVRRGVVGLLRLDPQGLRPHELSRGGSSETLRAQLEATACQLSLAMVVVPDRSGALAAYMAGQPGRPHIQVIDGDGVRNRVWIDEDPEQHVALIEALRDEAAVIADGHHRVDASMRHQAAKTAEGRASREAPWNYIMALVVPASDPGLRSRPTHRICERLGPAGRAFLDSLDGAFVRAPIAGPERAAAFLDEDGPPRFVLARVDGLEGLVLRSDGGDEARVTTALAGLPPALRVVDAAVLGAVVLDPLVAAELGAGWTGDGSDTGGAASGSRFSHNRASVDSILAQALAGEIDAAFLLRPAPPPQILAVAEAGELMPPKSTNFQPKPIKGLVINSLVSF